MDPDSGAETQKAVSLQWKSYKLVQDPAIRRDTQKIYRYDGVHFSVPDSGFNPVGELRDPRPRRLWSRYTELSLPVPKFKLDEFYVGPIPLKEVTFARLNDNIKEPFLAEMCAKFGEVEEMEILFHPKTKKHLGLARVLFTSTRGAKDTVKHLHNTSVMGNIIHAQLDIKGQQRHKYYDLIVNGSYTPQTVPLGGKALTDRLQPQTPTQPDTSSDIRRRLSNELAVLAAGVQALASGNVTPCSVDTSYSDQRLDTPPSSMAGPYTPGSSTSSQGGGTPYSSRSGTPFSQDSGYSGGRHAGYNTGALASSYPPQEMLPSSSSSSVVSSTVGGYKVSRYSEDAQDPSVYHRGRPMYPLNTSFRPNEPSCYPPYHGIGGSGPHMMHHSSMPPPPVGTQYDQASMSERERDRDRDLGARYGTGGVGSRRSSYHHQQDTNSSSKYHSHHSHHHSDRRDERGYRRDSVGSRSGEHQRHRNHHHSHNHHSSSRRRSSHDRDRERDRDRDGEYSNSSDPRYNSSSYRSSSNSMSPPPSSYSAYSSKEPAPAPPQGLDVSSRVGGPGPVEKGSLPGVAVDKDYHAAHHSVVPPPPPAPPPLPPASVIAAAVAETLGTLDFSQDSPVREDQWSKPKRRPSTPPAPPKTPPPSSPPQPSITSSSASPSSTSLPHHLPSSSSSHPAPKRDSSSPEPDSTNESLPFVYHSSSLDSRIEMLLKEQKAKFSFLASDEEDEEDRKEQKQKGVLRSRGEQKSVSGSVKGEHTSVNHTGDIVGKDHKKKGERDREDQRGRKEANVEEGRKSPTGIITSTPSSSTYSPQIRPPEDTQNLAGLAGPGTLQKESSQVGSTDIPIRTGAHTPPYNGQSQSSPHSSGEDMDISEEEEVETTITAVTTHQPSASSASPSSSQAAPPSQAADPSSSPPPISDSAQHFNTSIHPPIPSYPPHLPPPPPPGYSLQPPPPPGIPPLPHLELHPEYPPQMPHHMYDYAASMELMNQYSGGAPMSFQMQTHMLSRIHQLRMASANGTTGPGEAATADYASYHVHSMPPPHAHHPYMDQEGSSTGAHFDQDHRYMPPHMPYVYPDPHGTQIPPPPHHGIPPPHTDWPPHVLAPHYPSYMLPPAYGTLLPGNGGEYRTAGEEMPMLAENPHEATVQMVLATLIQEMKNIMQRDLNRKMVENVAFATFDEWWDRKETKAKPFQTMVRGLSALRDDEKKEEKVNRPREPLMSLVDWAKSGGMEGFSLRGALRLPSFKVKRKEPQELEEVDMKRPRPSTPPDEDDEAAEGRLPEADRRRAQRDNKRRKKKLRNRKPWELDSEGEETSDGSSTEKEDKNEEESEKESDDDATSVDSDDESLSSSSEGSSSSESSSSSSSENEDDEDGERVESEGPETMDESTMDSTIHDTGKEDDKENTAAAAPKRDVKTGEDRDKADVSTPNKRPPSPPRPSSPVVLVPPLKKRRKTVSFSTEENDSKTPLPTVAQSPSPSQAVGESPLLSPSRPPDSPVPAAPTPPARSILGIQLLPFASKPGEGNALIVPPFGRTHEPDENRKTQGASVSPQTTVKSPSKRGAVKDSHKSLAPPVMVCLTVQNLPLDHASMCRMAFEEAPPPSAIKRARGRPRTTSLSAFSRHSLRDDDEDEDGSEQRLRLREQLGASSLLQLATVPAADLSVLADVALKMDPEAGDSEETETSDEAEEQKMDDLFSPEMLALVMSPEGVVVLMEHNYCKPPVIPILSGTKRTSKQDSSTSLPGDLNTISGVLEAPEEVIGEMLPSRGDTGQYLSTMDELHHSEDVVPTSKRSIFVKGVELEKDKNRKRRGSDKENLEVSYVKKQKEQPSKKKKKKKQKLEDSDLDEDVDVEELESGELSSSDNEVVEEVRKSERLFLQEAGVTSSQRWPKPEPAPEPEPVKFDNRTEFEQMTILYDIWNSGLDGEDLMLLKKTYEKLLQDDHSSEWLNDTHWVNHTITNLPNARRKKKNTDTQLREHVTGCARSEGYYAISRKEKDVYLDLDLPEQVIREVENVDTTGTNRLLSERRSEQRRLLTVIGTPAVMDSDLLKLNQLKFRKKKLRFGRSRIHEWGLFAMEPIAADEMVIEYVGQNIRQMVADNREKRYAQQGIGSSYLFRVDHDTIIDATKCGNLARFINHCCSPNCYAKVITIESQKKIVIYSKQAIAVNEEITYDYKFPLEENKIPCLCGTENCRGTLN